MRRIKLQGVMTVPEMTMQRLDNYYILLKQKEFFEIKYIPSSISGVDTSRPAIQSNTISNVVENQVMQRLDIDPNIKAEYHRVCEELKVLNAFIFAIEDETIRAIAIRRFVYHQNYKKIGQVLNYTRESVYRMIVGYVER